MRCDDKNLRIGQHMTSSQNTAQCSAYDQFHHFQLSWRKPESWSVYSTIEKNSRLKLMYMNK